MAEKKQSKVDRIYTIPLRREFLKVPKYKRAKKAVTAVKQYLKKHIKSDDIKIGKSLNLNIWKHGIKNPPHHVKVEVTSDDEGIITAELFGAPKPIVKEESKKNKKEELKDKLEEVKEPKKESQAEKETKKPAENKKEVKEETKIKQSKTISKE